MDSEHAKGSETRHKSDRQCFSNIFLSLWKKNELENPCFSSIWNLETFCQHIETRWPVFLLSKNECLMKPIQMLLCRNEKIFSWFFSAFAESTSNFEYFQKKDESGKLIVSEIIDCKKQCYLKAEKATYQNTYGPSTC